jgi:tRNA 2-thiouridine synthesizing protein A
VGVRHTETNLIVWSAYALEPTAPATTAVPLPEPETADSGSDADQFYDAGDLGCAFGPLDEIARLMRRLQPGQTLEIRATDPTVAADLSAWCRMTGHTLVDQRGDRYLLRRN